MLSALGLRLKEVGEALASGIEFKGTPKNSVISINHILVQCLKKKPKLKKSMMNRISKFCKEVGSLTALCESMLDPESKQTNAFPQLCFYVLFRSLTFFRIRF